MKMKEHFRLWLQRRKARTHTQEYGTRTDTFILKDVGKIDFANWNNPLMAPMTITQGLVDFYKKFIKEGDLIIDIGANIGDTTVPMGIAAGISGITLAFDPNPFVFKILEINASLNKDKVRIIPLPYAITDKEDEFFYISSEASFSNGGLSKTKKSRHGKYIYPEKIKGIPLARYLEQNYKERLPKLSFIKIDTEGYDIEILKSISGLIEKYRPVVVFEVFKHDDSDSKQKLYNEIAKHGYDLFYFEKFDISAKVVRLENSLDILNWKETYNVYAVPKVGFKASS